MNVSKKTIIALSIVVLLATLYYFQQGIISIILFNAEGTSVQYTNKSETELFEYAFNMYNENEFNKVYAIGEQLSNQNGKRENAIGDYCKAMAYFGVGNYKRSLDYLDKSVDVIQNDRDYVIESSYYYFYFQNYNALNLYTDGNYELEKQEWLTKGIKTITEIEQLHENDIVTLKEMYFNLMDSYYNSDQLNKIPELIVDSSTLIGTNSTHFYYHTLISLNSKDELRVVEEEIEKYGVEIAPQTIYAMVEIKLQSQEYDEVKELLTVLDQKFGESSSVQFYYHYYLGKLSEAKADFLQAEIEYKKALDANHINLRWLPLYESIIRLDMDVNVYMTRLENEFNEGLKYEF